mgnify:CR=1 FL=1
MLHPQPARGGQVLRHGVGEDLQRAMEGAAAAGHPIQIDRVAPFAETDGFIRAQIDVTTEAFRAMRKQDPDGTIRFLFSTHSIPHTMNEASGDGTPGASYREQHLRVATKVAAGVRERVGEFFEWELVYNSRSGPAYIPWLEPDINDVITKLPAQGVSSVVTVPLGFISAHMEVVFDLDTEASATAAETGIGFIRAATVGTHPGIGEDLCDGVLRRRRLLALVGGGEVLDVVDRVVVRDVLQRVGDGLDEVFLANDRHGAWSPE